MQIVDDVIYMTGKGLVDAINREDGRELWRSKVKKSYMLLELAVTDDRVVIRVGGIFSIGGGQSMGG